MVKPLKRKHFLNVNGCSHLCVYFEKGWVLWTSKRKGPTSFHPSSKKTVDIHVCVCVCVNVLFHIPWAISVLL